MLKTECVLGTAMMFFNWGKKADVFKVATKYVVKSEVFEGRSDAILAIVEAMSDAQMRSQFALFFKDGLDGPSATLKEKLYEVLRVASYGSNATDKFTVWSKKFRVMSSLYGTVIKTVADSFYQTGSNTFAKWVGLIVEHSKDVTYMERSRDIQKWITNHHYQMLREVDLDFVIGAGNALLGETKASTVQEAVRKVVDIFQMIIEANSTVVVWSNDKMLWMLKDDTNGRAMNDVHMTDMGAKEVVGCAKRIVTPTKDEQSLKKMKVGDEPKLGRSLFSENEIGDDTGKLSNSSDEGNDTSGRKQVVEKSAGTLDVLEKSERYEIPIELKNLNSSEKLLVQEYVATMKPLAVHKIQGYTAGESFITNESIGSKVDTSNALAAIKTGDTIIQEFSRDLTMKSSNEGPGLNAYQQFLVLKKQFEPSPGGKFKNHIDRYDLMNII